MIDLLAAVSALAAAECGGQLPDAAPEPGSVFDYESVSSENPQFRVILRNEIVARRGTLAAFRQGAGLSRDSVEMPDRASVRGHFGILFPVEAGHGPRRRQWSYSPEPGELMARLAPGETGEIYVSERQGSSNRRYVMTVEFAGCEDVALGTARIATRHYRMRSGADAPVDIDRELWISRDEAWWVRETDHRLQVDTRLISVPAR